MSLTNEIISKTEVPRENSDFLIAEDSELILSDNNSSEVEYIEDSTSMIVSSNFKNDKIELTGEISVYQTKKNQTLMLVAFSIYGDYRKWREIADLNKDVLNGSYDLSHMPILKYKKPLHPYRSPLGDPNLIFAGFTLYYPSLNNIALNLY